MRMLHWMQKRFSKNIEQGTNVSTALWELDEEQHYPDGKTNSAQFRQPITLGVEIINEEEIVEMNPEFFHGFLAIGTLGSVIIPITPKSEAVHEEETSKREQILSKKLEDLTEKELEKDTKEKECYETPAKKEEEKEQKTTLDNTLKKHAISYKRSYNLEKGVKRATHPFYVMKKMLKKLDFTSRCSTTWDFKSNASLCCSTEKTPTKVFRKSSRKIHPQGADTHVNKSCKYAVKKMCYDKEVTSDDDDKETISSNMPFNMQPDGRGAHWIKTDADYFVLEF